MPKDNHSVMQLYLDGFENNFFTFFYVKDGKSLKINNNLLLKSQNNLRNKNISNITYFQKRPPKMCLGRKIYLFEALISKKEMKKHCQKYSVFLF